jgi:hypothetical protein
MRFPVYKKYGLTKAKFEKAELRNRSISNLLSHKLPLALGLVLGILFYILIFNRLNHSNIFEIIAQAFLFGTVGVLCVGIPVILFKSVEKLYFRYLKSISREYKNIQMYEKDKERYRYFRVRTDERFWKLLDGLSFEKEVLNIYSRLGYDVKSEMQGNGSKADYLLAGKDELFYLRFKARNQRASWEEEGIEFFEAHNCISK